MNSVDRILTDYQNRINRMTIKQGPTSEEIYQLLSQYNTNPISLEKSISDTVLYVDKTIKQYIGKFLSVGKAIDIVYSNYNQGNYLKYMKVHFHKHLPSISESIQIYLSINCANYSMVTSKIYEYLLENKISFDSRLSKIDRNDNFKIALYSKKNVIDVITYINETGLSNYLRELNPFIYQINKIGIVKETQKMPYNKFISNVVQDYIEECILNQQKNPYTSSDFQQFIANRYITADNYQDKMMSYNLACIIFSICTGEDVFKRLNDNYQVVFNRKKLNNYQYKFVNNSYCFYLNGKEVDYKTKNYLIAQLCLYNLLTNSNYNINNYQLNNEIVNKVMNDIEEILDNNECNIFMNYENKNIQGLIPYLYAYIAQMYKFCNEQECQKIIDIMLKKMIVLNSISDSKYVYSVNQQQIVSSIPLIKNDDGFCAIEYIDEELNCSNISVIKNGIVKTYLNVYINLDKEILKDDSNYYSRLYRNAISNALLNYQRNDRALQERQNDFSFCFLSDECEEVNEYANVAIIKKIFNRIKKIKSKIN